MKKVKLRKEKVVSTKSVIKSVLETKSDLDIFKSAWNGLPEDFTPEERLVFIELLERTIKIYNKYKKLYMEEKGEEEAN